ncbi:monovalent cation/H(+) antiporter subunit G [Petrotoga sp. 9PWA.NaAc.5.4]|uniref:cation:proton antiporter n=1 Tax=Petrotoga sp. 9PWA.NaAc.5.4 TaxID=1434328 RepID=UPI000CB8576C|nr:monovalent cation/H(+) antiporter subunit G [Petrotoga sp. 9PWA.NaAc.5.4]PNR92541.1 hypothetical protein X924_09075 [Petrotoga sp. 9PWA.NaAc.5.4]
MIISNIFLVSGIVFLIIGTIGLFTMEDLYSKIQAVGVSDTVGVFSIMVALILRYPEIVGRLSIIAVLVLILNPVISSIIGYSAAKSGEKLGKKN